MSSATIRRSTPARGARASATKARRRPPKRMTALDRAIALLPMSRETFARILSWGIVAMVAGAVAGAAVFLGLPAMAEQELARAAARAGFQVAKVEVRGIERMDEMPVYNIALGEVDRSMVTLDLATVRERLLTLGWVKDARVSRRLPDTLVVDIVERQPAAIWQHGGQLSLIDAQGVVLDRVDPRAMPDLPLVVGPGANRMTAALRDLLEAAPALKPMLVGATWVGNRRWDLRFQSGETLLLPEGDSQAAAALVNFARLDGSNRLLGRGILRFDMRDPTRFVLRLPEDRPKAEAPAAPAARPAEEKKAASTTQAEARQGEG
jgi:cell division protein FtsQ